MAEFTADLQSFRPLFPFLDIDNMELINQFKGVMNPHVLDNSILNMQNLMSFSSDSFLSSSETEFPGNLEEDFPAGLVHCVINHTNAALVSLPVSSAENEIHDEGKKRKATDMCGPSSENSSPAVSHSENKTKDVNFLPLFSFLFLIHNWQEDTPFLELVFIFYLFCMFSEFWKRQESKKGYNRR